MRFDLERHSPVFTDVHNTSIFTHAHKQVLLHFVSDLLAKLAQVHLGGLVRAVLRPHDRIHGQFRASGAAAQDLLDLFVLVFFQSKFRVWLLDLGVCSGVLNCFFHTLVGSACHRDPFLMARPYVLLRSLPVAGGEGRFEGPRPRSLRVWLGKGNYGRTVRHCVTAANAPCWSWTHVWVRPSAPSPKLTVTS